MTTVLEIIGIILIVIGLIFYLGAAVGLLRFPDFYTRMHAAGKGDTLSSLLIILGLAMFLISDFDWSHFTENWASLLVVLKLLAICGFIMLTSPTSTHALMDAGYEDGIEPKLKDGKRNDLDELKKA